MAALIALLAVLPAHAKPLKAVDFHSTDGVLRWINGYRAKPAPHSVPAALRALSRLGGLQDSERAGVYVGFLAGIVGSNPVAADAIIDQTLTIQREFKTRMTRRWRRPNRRR